MTTQSEAQGATTTRWAFDPYHTQVEFAAKHLGMMTVRGHFADVTASGNIYPDNPHSLRGKCNGRAKSYVPEPYDRNYGSS